VGKTRLARHGTDRAVTLTGPEQPDEFLNFSLTADEAG
jgi:hypothetical protein